MEADVAISVIPDFTAILSVSTVVVIRRELPRTSATISQVNAYVNRAMVVLDVISVHQDFGAFQTVRLANVQLTDRLAQCVDLTLVNVLVYKTLVVNNARTVPLVTFRILNVVRVSVTKLEVVVRRAISMDSVCVNETLLVKNARNVRMVSTTIHFAR